MKFHLLIAEVLAIIVLAVSTATGRIIQSEYIAFTNRIPSSQWPHDGLGRSHGFIWLLCWLLYPCLEL